MTDSPQILDSEREKLSNHFPKISRRKEQYLRNPQIKRKVSIESDTMLEKQNLDDDCDNQMISIDQIDFNIPENFLNHLDMTAAQDLIKQYVTPLDYQQPIQVIQNPTKYDEMITVQIVRQNVFRQASNDYLSKLSEIMLCPKDQNPLVDGKIAVKEGKNQGVQKCSQCLKDFGENNQVFKCKDTKCPTHVCPNCFYKYYVRRKLHEKSNNHYTYIDYQIDYAHNQQANQKNDFIKLKEIQQMNEEDQNENVSRFAVIGFWRNHSCYAQYRVDNPFIYKRKHEKTFLHLSDERELYFVQIDQGENNLRLGKIDMNKIKNQVKISSIIEFLPIFGETHPILNALNRKILLEQLFGENIIKESSCDQQTPLRIVKDFIILQINTEKKKKENNTQKERKLKCLNFVSQTEFDIPDGVVFITVLQQKDQIIYLDKKSKLRSLRWAQKESSNLKESLILDKSGEKVHQLVFRYANIQKVKINFKQPKNYFPFIESSILTSFVHGDQFTIIGDKQTFTFPIDYNNHDFEKSQLQQFYNSCEGHQNLTENGSLEFKIFVGLIPAQHETTTNMLPFEIQVYSIQKQEFDPKIQKTVVIKIPNDIIGSSADKETFIQQFSPITYGVVGEDQIECCIFIQESEKPVCQLIYARSPKMTIESEIKETNKMEDLHQRTKIYCMNKSTSLSYVWFRQENHTEFPIMISNTFHPKRNQILITNLTINGPRQMLNLGKYEIVKFVSSQEINNYQNQTKQSTGRINIYMLVQNSEEKDALKLMRYSVATVPEPQNVQKNQEIMPLGQIYFNVNNLKYTNEFQHSFNIQKAYLWRPQHIEHNDNYLILQKLERVLSFNLEEKNPLMTQVSEKNSILPIPFVFFNQYCYYVQKESNQSSTIVAIVIQRNQKPQIKKLQNQMSQIIAIRVKGDVLKNQEHLIDYMSSDKMLHTIKVIPEIDDLSVDLRFSSQKSTDQNLFHINKEIDWGDLMISDRSIQFREKGRVLTKIYDAYQLLEFEPLGFIKDIKDEEILKPYVFCAQINFCDHIKREQYMMIENDFAYVQTKLSYDSRKIDLISQKLHEQIESIQIWGSQIVVQFTNDNLVYFDQQTHMISKVMQLKFSERLAEIEFNQNEYYPIGNQFLVHDFHQEIKIIKHFGDYQYEELIADFKQLKQQLKKFLNEELKTKVKNYTRYPTIDKDGIPVILFLCEPKQNNEGFLSQNKNLQIIQQNLEYSTNQIKKSLHLDTDDDRLKDEAQVRKFEIRNSHQIYGTLSQNEEIKSDKIICVCYVVFDLDQKIMPDEKKFKMSVICSQNFLVWTTPKHINFVSLKKIQRVERFILNEKNFNNQQLVSVRSFRRVSKRIYDTVTKKFNQVQKNARKSYEKGFKNFKIAKLFSQASSDEDDDDESQERINLNVFINRIKLEKFFVSEIYTLPVQLLNLNSENRKFIVRDKKKRIDSIQIRVGDKISLMWDLKENEEITHLIGWSFLTNPDFIVRCGHQLNQFNLKDEGEIQTNQSCQIFANKKWCARLYAEVDLASMRDIQHACERGRYIKFIDEKMLLANINGQTFFTQFFNRYEQIQIVLNQIKSNEYKQVIEQWNLLEQVQDHVFIRQIYQILLLPTLIADKEEIKSSNKKLYKKNKYHSILKYSLHENKPLFELVLQILLMSSEMRLSNLVNLFNDMDQLLKISTPFVYEFLERSMIQTKQTKAITQLNSLEKYEAFIFGFNSPLLIEQIMIKKFQSNVDKKQETEILPFKVNVLEVEWLEGMIPKMLFRLVNSSEEIFENEFVINLMAQLDFSYEVYFTLILPYLVYMLLLVYYYLFYLTEGYDDQPGYFVGFQNGVIMRSLIMIFTIYFGVIEVIQLSMISLSQYLQSPLNLSIVVMLSFNMTIVVCQGNLSLSMIYLSYMASVASIQLWVQLFLWMRAFSQTSIFVMLVLETLKGLRYFLLIYALVLCAFGTSIAILDQYQLFKTLNTTNSYQALWDPTWGNLVSDVIINQYLLSIGQPTYQYFNLNDCYKLVWIYFILATFFCQILIFNMLIAIMQTTYDDVMGNKQRNILRMKTKLYSDYIQWLNLIGKKQKKLFAQRYIYSANLKKEYQNYDKNEEKIEQLCEKMNQGFLKIAFHFQETVEKIQQQRDDQLEILKVLTEIQSQLDKKKDDKDDWNKAMTHKMDSFLKKIELEIQN